MHFTLSFENSSVPKNNENECKYWIPELINVQNKHIHKWYENYKYYKNINYCFPLQEFYTPFEIQKK